MRVSYPADQQELEATASRLEGRKGVRYVIASSQEVGAETQMGAETAEKPSAPGGVWVKGQKHPGRSLFLQLSLWNLPLAEPGRKSAHRGSWEVKG